MILYVGSILLSELEGIIWYLNGNYDMATTQLRFTSILTSIVVILLSNKLILLHGFENVSCDKYRKLLMNTLVKIGDYSFSIYLSHILIMVFLNKLPGYSIVPFPVTTIVVLFVGCICVHIGKKLLRKKSNILGL